MRRSNHAPFVPEEPKLRSSDVRSSRIAVSGTRLEEADIAIAENLGRRRNDALVRAAGALSEIADQQPALTVCATVFAAGVIGRRPKLAEAGARAFASACLATTIKSAIKAIVSRTR